MQQAGKRVNCREYMFLFLYHLECTDQDSVLAKPPQEKIIRKVSSTECVLSENQMKLHQNKATIPDN